MTTRPWPLLRRRGTKRLVMRKGPSVFARHVSSNSPGSTSTMLLPSSSRMAALLTSTSSWPISDSTNRPMASIDCAAAVSRTCPTACDPIFSATLRTVAASRLVTTTRYPRAASCRATSWPMPRLDPVTRAMRLTAAVYAGAGAPCTARRSAARASKRVESSVGSGEFKSFMINGISVQPSTTASQPSSFIRPMTR